jgi:hypothetical protein
MARQITQEDLNENFPELLRLAEQGLCVIPGCGKASELVTYAPNENPILCYEHVDDGSLTHCGEYLPSQKNAYYNIYTCCSNSWKLSKCSRLTEKFRGITSIPRNDQQQKNMEERLEFLKRQAEEQERYERMINAGREEAYDR